MIILISASWDLTPQIISKYLTKLGYLNYIFFTDKYSNSNFIKYTDTLPEIIINNKKIRLNSIDSLLVRHPFYWYPLTATQSDEECLFEEYRRIEINDITKGFIFECEQQNIFTINNFDKNIEKKLPNLISAKKMGFITPNTVISNNYRDLIHIANKHNRLIIKSFIGGAQYGKKEISKKIFETTSAQLISELRNLNVTYPLQVQEKIDKQFDLRINVVGKKIFPCAIYSQENPKTLLDVRESDFEDVRHEEYKLPKKIEELCFKLCKENNLNYGAIDMALDTKGRYVFFEINPYGEYLWIEEKTGMPISEAIAELLINSKKNKLV